MSIDNVNDTAPRVQYAAAAAQTDFDYPFAIFAEADLVVYVDGTLQVLNTDYTVIGETEDDGGTVAFLTPMTGGEVVTLYRDTGISRTSDYQQNGPLTSASINDDFDKLTVIAQELEARIERCLRIPMIADVDSADIEFSPISNWTGKYVYINSSGVPEPATAVTAGTTLSQSTIGAALYPQTAAELAAGVTPSSYAYPPGNVLRYGATGDGVADDTTAIQAAISVLPLNTADTGVLSPKGFANGGEIRIPAGRYKVTGAINLQRGVRIVGDGRESTQILSFTAGSVFKYTDAGGYLQDEIHVRDLSIWQDASVVAASGAGIEIIDGSYSPDSIQAHVENVSIEGTYDGISIAACIGSSVRNCNVLKCVRYGISLNKIGTSNTSTTVQNSYSQQNGSHGMFVDGASYVSFIGCASDSNTGYGYYLDTINGFSIIASGAEQNVAGGAYFKDTLSGFVQLHLVVQAGALHGITLDNANGITLQSCDFLSDASTTGYAINFVTAKPVLVLSPQYTGGFLTNKFSSADYGLTFNGTGWVKGGDTSIWTFGAANAKDLTAQLAVVGNSESTVTTGLKSGVTFTATGASRNTAIEAQLTTANTAVTYPLTVGVRVPNSSKGAASTITRSAGLYVNEQTNGGTANANLMIDATAGTVPAGNWSIYSDSTRPSMFKGCIAFTAQTAASASNNSIFVDSADGVLKFKDSGGTSYSLY